MEKIFEPFQSQFEGGTGLGLAIVYQIVQAHEGKVWARSKLGEGSDFVLRLRRRTAEEDQRPRVFRRRHGLAVAGGASRVRRRPREEARMGNILVCDDERSICEMLDIALRRDGHKVETVNSGEAAKRKLDSALYDVVVTDIKMPHTDGIEVLRYAHQVSPESAVILITAVDDYEAAVQAVKAGGATRLHPQVPRPGG